jgi:hypothetical protein
MGRLRRKPVPPGLAEEMWRDLMRGESAVHALRFRHAGKRYLAYESGIPELPAGTLVASSHWSAVIAEGHVAAPDELASALDAFESRSAERGGS